MNEYSRNHFANGNYVLQHDNCPCHTAGIVKDFLRGKNVRVLDWPSNSPDINPIENLWADAKKHLSRIDSCVDAASFQTDLVNYWAQYNSSRLYVVQNLIASMKDRCKALVDNYGDYLKY